MGWNIFAIIGLIVFSWSVQASQWSANVALSPNGIPSGEPVVAADDLGHVYVAYMEHVNFSEGPIKVRLIVSDDDGSTFRSIGVFQSESSNHNAFTGDVTLAATSDGNVYFGYIDYRYDASGSRIMMIRSGDYGKTWSKPVAIANTEGGAFEDRPWFTIGSDGILHLVYGTLESATSATSKYTRSSDGGKSWTAPVNLGLAQEENGALTGTIIYTAALATSHEVTMAAHASSKTEGQHIRLFSSTDGNSFQVTKEYPLQTPMRAFPLVSGNPKGACVAFLDGQGEKMGLFGDILNKPSASPVQINTPGTLAWSPWITTDVSGNCQLIWIEGNLDGKFKVMSATLNLNGVVTNQVPVSDTTFSFGGEEEKWPGDYISVATNLKHRYAVWTDARSSISRVYFSKSELK
jgi:hypothetical protein